MLMLKLRPHIDPENFDAKVRAAESQLQAGKQVTVLVKFVGREVFHPEAGTALLERFATAVADTGNVGRRRVEDRYVDMVLLPKVEPPSE